MMTRMLFCSVLLTVLQPCSAVERLDRSDEIAKTPERAFEYIIRCDRVDGVYKVGETAEFSVRVREKDGSVPLSGMLTIEFDGYDDRTFKTETRDLAKDGALLTLRAGLDHPGILRMKIRVGDSDKVSIWGVAFDPHLIPPDSEAPSDFDRFWAQAVAKYDHEVPEDFELRLDADLTTPWNDVYRISFTAPDNSLLYGFVSYPKDRTRKYPARFEVPSAGVGGWTLGPSTYQRDRCVNMILNIFPFDMPETVEAARVPYEAWTKMLKEKYGASHYMSAGIGESREAFTIYNYLLGANRAIEWLWRQREVDQTRFWYWGASQGGGYGTLVMGLNHRFTKGCLLVPCLTNALGRDGRLGTFFGWRQQNTPERQATAKKWIPYFAPESFARRITCPTMVSVGLCDPTCPPHGGWSIYNLIPAKDKVIVGAVNQPHGPPDPIWYGTQQWMMDDPGWKVTFGEQYKYIHWNCSDNLSK